MMDTGWSAPGQNGEHCSEGRHSNNLTPKFGQQWLQRKEKLNSPSFWVALPQLDIKSEEPQSAYLLLVCTFPL